MIGEELTTIPRIYTALAEWAACMVYLLQFDRRLKNARFAAVSAAFLVLLIIYQHFADSLSIYMWVPAMAGAVGIMFAFIRSMLYINNYSALGLCMYSFILAELLASAAWQVYYYLATRHVLYRGVLAQVVILALIYAIGLSGIFLLERRYLKHRPLKAFEPKEAVATAVIVAFFFAFSNISFVSVNTPFSGNTLHEIFYIRTLVDFSGLVVLFAAREQKLWHFTQSNLDAMEMAFKRHHEQYVASKESIDMINRKYHDMKHLISVIRAERDSNKKDEHLNILEDEIKAYEAQNKTGNAILDTILTSKALSCGAKDIQFTCIADGALLEFMNVMDICSVFGNALDNAIESADKISERDKRLIKVAVYRQNEFLIIRFENYYENDLTFENGDLITTKKNKDFHGFGMKSIKSVAEKYGGSMMVTTENNWFTMCVLIPF